MFFTYMDLGLLVVYESRGFLGLVTVTTLSPGSGAVLLLLRIGSGVPDIFQLGELLVHGCC